MNRTNVTYRPLGEFIKLVDELDKEVVCAKFAHMGIGGEQRAFFACSIFFDK